MSEPPSLGWGHINVNVRELARSIAFYRQLGFSELMPGIPYLDLRAAGAPRLLPPAQALGLAPGTRGRGCILQLGNGFPKLDLTELIVPGGAEDATDAPAAPRPPPGNGDLGVVRFCLASKDLAGDHRRLAGQGVTFLRPPRACHDGLADIAVCVDPDGTLIELIEIHPQRWAGRD